jgi:hypothetical protein
MCEVEELGADWEEKPYADQEDDDEWHQWLEDNDDQW